MTHHLVVITWSVLALMYISTAIYYELRHGDKISNYDTATMLAIGFLVLAALNQRVVIVSPFWTGVTEVLMICLLFLAWFFATMSMYKKVQYKSNHGELF